ncbi:MULTISPECIES: 16S rRNA (cytosine(1402)-N(4))-methyltransferase RsmH [unclassified Adlercreutzia]|uniref:16S rRNA (cytosine(1402)-N(4))-methyltransferase RsmH n=1 Tax=unclassified Adlercreutzia TaxID=2636013 RepID=UPI0013EB9058|nr:MULTISPECIES: 16S rRNA (cytosine(1402)-N(4))-methyltransferase RsmH [unclassified Adlercreutzia]
MTSEYRHIPVLSAECIDALACQPGCVHLDATLGFAGHAMLVAAKLGREGLLIGIDQDAVAREEAKQKLSKLPADVKPHIEVLAGNFGNMDELLMGIPIVGIDSVLFDLGVSSVQLDTPSRGFSYKEGAPLDMRMDPSNQTLTAQEVINTYNAADLARIIRTNSDERWASRIAEFIVKSRAEVPIRTSDQLVDIIKAAIPAAERRHGGHPAKRTFQAIRIHVNSELEVLRSGLDAAIRWLNPGGRIAVISYHSLEDRIVKETFASFENRCTCPPDFPVCACGRKPILKVLTRKPVLPDAAEVDRNPRARSAKLRVAQKL